MDKKIKEDFIAAAMKGLGGVSPENGDIYELVAILASDIADMENAKNKQQFKKQRKDCYETFKAVRKALRKVNYK